MMRMAKPVLAALVAVTVLPVCGPDPAVAQTPTLREVQATAGLGFGWRETPSGPNDMLVLQYRIAVSPAEGWMIEGGYSKWAWGIVCWPEQQCGSGDGIQLGGERRYRPGHWLQPYLNASAGIIWWGIDDTVVPTASTGAGLQATGGPFTARLELVHQYTAIYDAYDPFVFLRLSVGLRFDQSAATEGPDRH